MGPRMDDGRQAGEASERVGARLARLWETVLALLQLRIRQAQGDAQAAVRRLVMGLAFGAIALVLVLLMLPLLVTVLILVLATVLPAWLAALVVLAVVLAAVAALLLLARSRLRWRGISLLQDLRADWDAVRQKVGQSR